MTDRKESSSKAARRRRAERLLGELLPDQTRDDSAEEWGELPENQDDELRRNVPPHHAE